MRRTQAPSATPGSTLLALCAVELSALGSLVVPLSIGLAIKVRSLNTSMSPEEALGIITAAGAAAAMVANLSFGRWSDQSAQPNRSRWIIGGVLAGALVAPLALYVHTVAALTVVWCLLQITYNATFAGLYGTIADVVPETDRSRVSGIFAASATGSILLGLGLVTFLPKTVEVAFLVMPPIAAVVSCLAFPVLRRLGRPERVKVANEGWRAVLRASSQYWWVWTQRLLGQLGYVFATLFGLFYLIRRAGMEDAHAATWVTATGAAAAALSIVAAVVAGRVAKRSRSYAPFLVVGLGCIGVALALKTATTSPVAFLIATLLAGLGSGAYYAVDLALVLHVLPQSSAGTLLGFFNISRTLPQSLAPLFAPPLLAIGGSDVVGVDRSQNYFALYVAGLLVVGLALLLIVPIRTQRVGLLGDPPLPVP